MDRQTTAVIHTQSLKERMRTRTWQRRCEEVIHLCLNVSRVEWWREIEQKGSECWQRGFRRLICSLSFLHQLLKERKIRQRLALIVVLEVKFIILTNVWLVCMSEGTRSKFGLCQEEQKEHFIPKLLNYIDKVFWPYSPVKKSVKIWNMKVSCTGSLISSCLAAGESWCWLGSVRRKAPPAGRGG